MLAVLNTTTQLDLPPVVVVVLRIVALESFEHGLCFIRQHDIHRGGRLLNTHCCIVNDWQLLSMEQDAKSVEEGRGSVVRKCWT